MAKRTALKPWHEVVQLRDDLKTGELSLSIFAADLYDVVMQKGQRSSMRSRPSSSHSPIPPTTFGSWSRTSAYAWTVGATRLTESSP